MELQGGAAFHETVEQQELYQAATLLWHFRYAPGSWLPAFKRNDSRYKLRVRNELMEPGRCNHELADAIRKALTKIVWESKELDGLRPTGRVILHSWESREAATSSPTTTPR